MSTGVINKTALKLNTFVTHPVMHFFDTIFGYSRERGKDFQRDTEIKYQNQKTMLESGHILGDVNVGYVLIYQMFSWQVKLWYVAFRKRILGTASPHLCACRCCI